MTQSPSAMPPDTPNDLIVAGVDTHAATHHAAVLSHTGARIGDREFPANLSGYQGLLDFIQSFGTVSLIGVEGTSSYGAGLARFLMSRDVPVREVIRPRREHRRRGKSDPIDAYAAAGQALAEADRLPIAKTGTGLVEQIRALMVVRRSAMKARVAALRQIKSLLITAPEDLRDKWEKVEDGALIDKIAATRPADASISVETATNHALRRLARRHQYLSEEITSIDGELRGMVNAQAPAMLATKGYGLITTATLLITAGSNPDRLHSEASFAALCGASPIPASSGKTNRHRLNRGGDRQANWALHQIALVRLSNDERTKAYSRRLQESGKTKKDVLRILKRTIAREAFHLIVHPQPVPVTADLRALRHERGATILEVAMSIGTDPARISELERGKRPNAELTRTYRAWLNAA